MGVCLSYFMTQRSKTVLNSFSRSLRNCKKKQDGVCQWRSCKAGGFHWGQRVRNWVPWASSPTEWQLTDSLRSPEKQSGLSLCIPKTGSAASQSRDCWVHAVPHNPKVSENILMEQLPGAFSLAGTSTCFEQTHSICYYSL